MFGPFFSGKYRRRLTADLFTLCVHGSVTFGPNQSRTDCRSLTHNKIQDLQNKRCRVMVKISITSKQLQALCVFVCDYTFVTAVAVAVSLIIQCSIALPMKRNSFQSWHLFLGFCVNKMTQSTAEIVPAPEGGREPVGRATEVVDFSQRLHAKLLQMKNETKRNETNFEQSRERTGYAQRTTGSTTVFVTWPKVRSGSSSSSRGSRRGSRGCRGHGLRGNRTFQRIRTRI